LYITIIYKKINQPQSGNSANFAAKNGDIFFGFQLNASHPGHRIGL
jgi:hypothetical protein